MTSDDEARRALELRAEVVGNLRAALERAGRTHLAPPPTFTVSEWADRHRQLSSESSAEPGQWETSRVEYTREIMDAASDPDCSELVWVAASQTAKTETLKPVFQALVEELSTPRSVGNLATTLERQPIDAVVAVMRSEIAIDLWRTVFSSIDQGRWFESRSAESKPKPNAFVAFQRVAAEQNRSELARAPALRLVVESSPEDWHKSGVSLVHLSHVVRLAVDASEAEIDTFLARIATSEWIDIQFASAPVGGLAGSLLAFASTLGVQRSACFRRASLERRIEREISSVERCNAEEVARTLSLRANRTAWLQRASLERRSVQKLSSDGKGNVEEAAQALSLLGSAAAIGMSVRVSTAQRPSSGLLAEILALRLPDQDRPSIGPIQVGLWLGLREMARLRGESPKVPPELAEPVLDLWIATHQSEFGQALPTHVRALNAEMIAWMQQCKATGWRLEPQITTSSTADEHGQR
jgi:hypothetical protein